jgi:hypothetical protein
MESTAAPNSGVCLRSCGIVEAALLAKDARHLVIVSDVTHSALLTSPRGFKF